MCSNGYFVVIMVKYGNVEKELALFNVLQMHDAPYFVPHTNALNVLNVDFRTYCVFLFTQVGRQQIANRFFDKEIEGQTRQGGVTEGGTVIAKIPFFYHFLKGKSQSFLQGVVLHSVPVLFAYARGL